MRLAVIVKKENCGIRKSIKCILYKIIVHLKWFHDDFRLEKTFLGLKVVSKLGIKWDFFLN